MKKIFAAIFPALACASLYCWYVNNNNAPAGSYFADRLGLAMAFGRLAGIVGALGVMAQLLLVSRAGWLEPPFGLDRLTRLHHYAGLAIPLALFVHPPLVVWHHAMQTGAGFMEQYGQVLKWDDVLPAAIGGGLIVTAVFLSLPFARRRLSYEAWHTAHLFTYLGLALSIGHQLELGGDVNAELPYFKRIWFVLLFFTAANMLWYRLLKPLRLYKKHRFTVDRTVMETPDVMSIYIKGKELETFKFEAGQFALFRFWAPGFRLQTHPFSFSKAQGGGELRLSVKKLGDFTAMLHSGLKPGTPVIIDGPHGIFTADRMKTDKALLVAGGIGITPLRAIAERLAAEGRDAVLVYANRRRSDAAFGAEFSALSAGGRLRTVDVLSDEPEWSGEKGFLDAARLRRLVPDLDCRDAFLCGPPQMVSSLTAGLRAAGLPSERTHYERFSL